MNVKRLLENIPDKLENKRFIVGIDGLSRSGKTTLVKELRHQLEEKKIAHHIFHIDDYIVEKKKRYDTGHEQWFEYYSLQWDIELLRKHFFEPLRLSNELRLPYYEGETDTQIIQDIFLPKSCVVIVEGVFLQRQEWRNYYDYIVYLDCPREKRFLRESVETQRNIRKFEERYWKAEDYYLNHEQPLEHADAVFQG